MKGKNWTDSWDCFRFENRERISSALDEDRNFFLFEFETLFVFCTWNYSTVHILLLLCRRTVLVHWGFASKPTGLGFFHVPVIILLFFFFFWGGGVDYEDDISPDMFAACASFWHKSDSESSRWHCAPSDGSGSRSLSERLSRRGCKAAWRFRWTRRLRLSSL